MPSWPASCRLSRMATAILMVREIRTARTAVAAAVVGAAVVDVPVGVGVDADVVGVAVEDEAFTCHV